MRGWQVLLLILVAGSIGLATGSHPIQIATLALGLVLVMGMLYRVLLAGDVESVRTIGDAVVPWGAMFPQRIELTNHSRLPIPAIRLSDYSTLPEHPHGYVASLRSRGTIAWEIELPCEQRGRYRLGPVEAYMSDPLGLFPVQRRLGPASSVLVLPRWVLLRHSALKLDGFMTGEARGRHTSESPPAVASVRDYAAGDSLAAIHWPATARTGHLMTKQFDPLVQTTLWLALDLDGPLSREVEELLVTAAASLGIYGLQRAQLRVGLVASGGIPLTLAAERGKPHQLQLLEVLAEVRSGTDKPLTDQMARMDRQLGPGQVVTLVTSRAPEVWGAWVGRLVRRGVALRVVQVQAGNETESAGAWPVPSIHVPVALADLTQDAALIAVLEGRAAR